MKKISLFLIILFTLTASSFAGSFEKAAVVINSGNTWDTSRFAGCSVINGPGIRIKVSRMIIIHGCKFQVEGWIDVSVHPLWGFQLDSWDLYFTGLPPCGNYHIQGLAANPAGSDDFDPAAIDIDPFIISIFEKG